MVRWVMRAAPRLCIFLLGFSKPDYLEKLGCYKTHPTLGCMFLKKHFYLGTIAATKNYRAMLSWSIFVP